MPKSPSSTLVYSIQNHPFATRAIPILDTSRSTVGRTAIPIDLDDPRSTEPLIDVRTLGVLGDNFYARTDGMNPPYRVRINEAIADLLLREVAARNVAEADTALRPFGLRLHVLDAYRPISTQQGLWDFFYNSLRVKYPSFTQAQLDAETLKFVSDPRGFDRADQRTWPLHSTGGAVDLTLVGANGETINFGAPFDDATDLAETAYFERQFAVGKVGEDDLRLISRRILYGSMVEAGFTNYVGEWWHFDYGNQMHVFTLDLLGRPVVSGKAWYGYTEPYHAD